MDEIVYACYMSMSNVDIDELSKTLKMNWVLIN